MNAATVLEQLEALGTARNREIYPRHGVRGPLFGVSYADLGRLKKRVGTDHALALELWKSGNHDARVLATMVADPGAIAARDLDRWAKDIDNKVIADAFACVAAASRHARERVQRWTRASGEWPAGLGWSVLARLAMDRAALPDEDLAPYAQAIEKTIHRAPNRTRHAMLMALIAIGIRGGALREKAVAAARRIGKVEIDHGKTGCKTPDVVAYIEKTLAHRAMQTRAAR